jgi:phage-related baseplate assembly protein
MNATGDTAAAADVYEGDTPSPDLSSEDATNVFLFAIEAEAEPDVLARVANLFNLTNVAPLTANLRRESSERVTILVEMELISASTADLIRRKLAQLTCIISVELTVQIVMRRTFGVK